MPSRSAVDNVFLGIESHLGPFVRSAAERFAGLVEEHGIDVPPDGIVGRLSVAEQQKVEILRALARRAALIVMDEPTARLTSDEAMGLRGTVRTLADRGVTVVYVSHFLDEVLAVADEITILRDGAVVRSGPAATETRRSLIEGIVGRDLAAAFPPRRLPPASAPTVLAVRELSRSGAFSDVSFEVRAGEIVTLAHLAGFVTIGGVVRRARERAAAARVTGAVGLTGATTASLMAELSGGNQQKSLFARWLVERPRLFLSDEPTRGVDVGAKRGIYDLLVDLASEGMAVIVVSSELEEVLGIAHRILVMRGGRLVGELDAAAATRSDVMELAFGALGRMNTGAGNSLAQRLRRLRPGDYGIVWVTIGLFVLLTQTTDVFLSAANLRNVLDQQSLLLIAGSAMTLTLIGGNFDISVSASFINAGIVTALIANGSDSVVVAIAGGVGIGAAFGLLNGVTVAWVRINSFIATLATSFVFYGVGFLLSERSIIRISDRSFSDVARARTLGVTNATWIAAVVVVVLWLVLERTRFGRHVFAAGGNPEAARLAGVRVEAIVVATFVITGAAAGLAGALSASRTLVAQPSDDFSFVFSVLTAVIVGGTSIAGGEGAVWRTVFGAFFTAFMLNGFNLHQIDPIIQRLIQGSVILVAVAADNWTRSRRSV